MSGTRFPEAGGSAAHDRHSARHGPFSRGWKCEPLLTTVPVGFSETLAANNLQSPTAIDVLPDGRVLIASKAGAVHVIKNGVQLPTPFLTLNVDSTSDRGLLGIVHDPNFATNHFIYLYHTVPAAGSALPFSEVSRFTANGDVMLANSEVDFLRLPDLSATAIHLGGAIHFGQDGMLYVASGDLLDPTNAQTLGNLAGKVLRLDVSKTQPGDPINDAAKLVPSTNPFVGVATGINQTIYAPGIPQPLQFRRTAGHRNDFCERRRAGQLGGNRQARPRWELRLVQERGLPKSDRLARDARRYQDPQLAYSHTGGIAGGGTAITGGTFYAPPAGATHPFPTSYTGRYLYQDFLTSWIRNFDPAKPGSLSVPDTSTGFATGEAVLAVDMAVAPDGGLFYISLSRSELLKISYTGNSTPTIVDQPAKVTVAAGDPATFTVNASGPGTLSYQWQRNNGTGGAFVNIAEANAQSFTLNNAQPADNNALFRVVVSSSLGSVTSNPASPVVLTPVRIEAESLALSTYFVEAETSASGGNEISLNTGVAAPQSGTASGVFNGLSGKYTVVAGYYDENDGTAGFSLTLGGTPAASWLANQDLGSIYADASTHTTRTLGTFNLTKGETLVLGGTSSNKEFARWDYVDFIPVSVAPPPPTPIRIEAESLALSNYFVEAETAQSGGNEISLNTGVAAPQSGTASGIFNGPTGKYTVVAGYYDENDGVATFSLTLGGTLAASWSANQDLGSIYADASTHTKRTLGTFNLTKGESLALGGTSDNKEFARWDYLDFIPA